MTNTLRPAVIACEGADQAIATAEAGEVASFEFSSEMITVQRITSGASPYFRAECGNYVAVGNTAKEAIDDLITLRW